MTKTMLNASPTPPPHDNWTMRSLALMMAPLSTFVKRHEPQERPEVQFIGI